MVLSSREMGRIFHAKDVERLVRNDLWKGRSPERFYDAMEWLYGWTGRQLSGQMTPNCDSDWLPTVLDPAGTGGAMETRSKT